MSKENEGKKMGLAAEVSREGYEATVMERMKGRAGASSPKGAPGNALEIMANDKSNLKNVLKPDTVTRLTKSSTAKQVDAVTMKGNKIIERIQYKDTVSPAGVKKTLDQVESGKYRQTQLRGTKEATEKYNAAARSKGVKKTMKSTGISHDTTQRVGDKFTKQPIKPASLGNAVKGSVSFAVGATAVVEVAKSLAGNDTVGECAGHVVSKGAENALTTTAAVVAGEVTTSVVGGLAIASVIPGVGPAAGMAAAIATGITVGKATDGVFDGIGEGIGNAIDDAAFNVAMAVEEAKLHAFCFFDDVKSFFQSL